ncbi:MAG TPA: hypothetical protein VFN23_11920 [Ktedonobacteraceae bacterium]|nr:hypothetical protein [Ktedonobacteraceae bacterium]
MSRDNQRSREYGEESGQFEEEYRPRRRRQSAYEDDEYEHEPARPRRQRRRRRRSIWPFLLIGCGGIICLIIIFVALAILRFGSSINSNSNGGFGGLGISPDSTYTQPESQTLPVGHLSNIQINNQVGNVTVLVDPKATEAMVQTTKKVKASSKSLADQEFRNLIVKIQQDSSANLNIDGTIPTQNGTVFNNNNDDSVDLQITLPPSASGQPTALILGINLSVGQVKVSGLSGWFTINNKIGDVIVQGANLVPGSKITSTNGNVTFSGTLITNVSGPATPTPVVGAPGVTPTPSGNQPIYTFKSEVGNLDITIPATNVTLDANSNSGKLTSDFQLTPAPTQDGNSVTFYGPLMPQTNPAQILIAHVGSGNITLHQAS